MTLGSWWVTWCWAAPRRYWPDCYWRPRLKGNPFFTRELVGALRESGQLLLEDGEWVLSAGMIDALRTANALVREEGMWVLAQAADLSTITLGIP